MATKKVKVVAKRGPGRPPKVVKRGPGRPKGSGAKRGRKPSRQVDTAVSQAELEAEAAADHEAPAVTAADLITDIRPHIKGIDAVISGCVVAGVDPYLVVKFQTDSTSLFENMLLALARAP